MLKCGFFIFLFVYLMILVLFDVEKWCLSLLMILCGLLIMIGYICFCTFVTYLSTFYSMGFP